MYVIAVEGEGEPEVLGPFSDEETLRLVALRRHAARDTAGTAVFVLVVSEVGGDLRAEAYGTGVTSSLAGGELEQGPYCSMCLKLAGPDYHLAGYGSEGECLVVCPGCFDERMR